MTTPSISDFINRVNGIIDGLLSLSEEQVQSLSSRYPDVVTIRNIGQRDRSQAWLRIGNKSEETLIALLRAIKDLK